MMMKIKSSNLNYLQGDQAYQIYWQQYYHCKPLLSTIMAIDMNLEIVVDNEGKLLAYRYDLPDDMRWMVINSDRWYIFNEELMSPFIFYELQRLIVKIRFALFLN